MKSISLRKSLLFVILVVIPIFTFTMCTPAPSGGGDGGAGENRVATPEFNHPSGTILDQTKRLIITTATPDASIIYTLDGTKPSAGSENTFNFTNPKGHSYKLLQRYAVKGKIIVTTVAQKQGMLDSQEAVATYEMPKVPNPVKNLRISQKEGDTFTVVVEWDAPDAPDEYHGAHDAYMLRYFIREYQQDPVDYEEKDIADTRFEIVCQGLNANVAVMAFATNDEGESAYVGPVSITTRSLMTFTSETTGN